MKAVHHRRGARAVLGPNVRGLIQSLDPPVDALGARLDDARDLDLFYVVSRYPNGLEEGVPSEAFSDAQSKRALAGATAIVEAAAESAA